MAEKWTEADYARAKALIADLKAAGLIRGPLPEDEYLRLWEIALKHTSAALSPTEAENG